MTMGFGLLRLSSRDFWSMTPREIGHALGFHAREFAEAPGRADLAAMIAAYPDQGGSRDG